MADAETTSTNRPSYQQLLALVPKEWKSACGMAFVKPRFSFNNELDQLFALGWPHLRFVESSPLPERTAIELTGKALEPMDLTPRICWNRRIAQNLVRAWGSASIYEISLDERTIRPQIEELLWNPDPLQDAEIEQLLWRRMTNGALQMSDRTVENFVLLMEAQVGTLAVATTIVELLESLEEWMLMSRWSLPPFVTYQLGYLLLRLSPQQSEGLKNRLARILHRYMGEVRKHRAAWEDGFTHLRAIHLVLNGAEAARRGADRNLSWYTHVQDDATFIRMRVAMDRLGYRPDARLVFLGGLDVLASYAGRWDRLSTEEQRWYLEQFGAIRGQATYEIMLEMTTLPVVGQEATQWFVEQAEFTRDFLRSLVEGNNRASVQARALLKKLD